MTSENFALAGALLGLLTLVVAAVALAVSWFAGRQERRYLPVDALRAAERERKQYIKVDFPSRSGAHPYTTKGLK